MLLGEELLRLKTCALYRIRCWESSSNAVPEQIRGKRLTVNWPSLVVTQSVHVTRAAGQGTAWALQRCTGLKHGNFTNTKLPPPLPSGPWTCQPPTLDLAHCSPHPTQVTYAGFPTWLTYKILYTQIPGAVNYCTHLLPV